MRSPGSPRVFGGGILSASPLTLNGTLITGNDATGSGASGGGVWNFNTPTLIGSPILNNVANGNEASGGGLWNAGSLNITSSPITGNTATGTNARGGSIVNETGSATLLGVPVVSNRAVEAAQQRHGHAHRQRRGRQPAQQLRQPQHRARLFPGHGARVAVTAEWGTACAAGRGGFAALDPNSSISAMRDIAEAAARIADRR